MNIRKRLTATFTLLTGFVTFVLCIIVYQTASNSREALFQERLLDRLEVSEQFYLESSSLSILQREELKTKFMQTLTDETELAFRLDSAKAMLSNYTEEYVPTDILEQTEGATPKFWIKNQREGVANQYAIGGEEYVVLVLATDSFGWAFLEKLRNILLFCFLFSILVSAILSRMFAKQALKPIVHKISKANSISAEDLNERLTVYNENDEIGMLAISFNQLLDRIQSSFELQKNFVRYASHELRNPLAVILGETELVLSKDRSKNEYISTIQKTNAQAEKLNSLVSHFLKLSRLEENAKELSQEIRIDEVLMSSIIEVNQSYERREITYKINVEHEDALTLMGEEELLKTAFVNLIDNACKYSTEEVLVSVYMNPKLTIKISDSGIGIAKGDSKLIFQPLYRSTNSTKFEGTGIGLSLVKKIIDIHSGKITLTSVPNKETSFTISFGSE
ncbi:MAG: ATP-binding protein [Flavobacteriales bacterium]